MMNAFTKHYIKLTPGKIELDVYLNIKFLKKKTYRKHVLMEQEQ